MKSEWKTILPLLHDTHCHVNLYPDPDGVREQIAIDCMQVVHVTTSPAEYAECAAAENSTVALAPGLIPQDIGELAPQLDYFCELIAGARFVGEVGLDYVTEDEGERQLQRRVFERILRCCEDCGDRILTIHSRRAAADVITMLDGFGGTPILHWFSGTQEHVHAAPENVYFSINTAMIASRTTSRISGVSTNGSPRIRRASSRESVGSGSAYGTPNRLSSTTLPRGSPRSQVP